MWNGLNNFTIKVRAWIPEENIMIYSDHDPEDYNPKGVYYFGFNSSGELVLFEVMDTANDGDIHVDREVKEAIIMPCIQLDLYKVGDIHVGDFVQFKHDRWDEYKIGIVEFDTDDGIPQFYISYDYGNVIDFQHSIIKVIGNVFENEELFDDSLV